jgi:hypothetical protein
MPFRLPNAADLDGDPQVGNAECVALIKMKVPGLIGIGTINWKEGAPVKSLPNLARGTAIATFVNGRYPQAGSTGKHACIFLSHAGAGIWVIDQYVRSGTIIKRHIGVPRDHQRRPDGSWGNASNNAMAFSVIER